MNLKFYSLLIYMLHLIFSLLFFCPSAREFLVLSLCHFIPLHIWFLHRTVVVFFLPGLQTHGQYPARVLILRVGTAV